MKTLIELLEKRQELIKQRDQLIKTYEKTLATIGAEQKDRQYSNN